MGQVTVRNLDDRAIDAWKARARANGRSLESELRLTLEGVVAAGRSVGEERTTYDAEPMARLGDPLPASQAFRHPKPAKFPLVTPIRVKGKSVSESLIEDRR